MKLYIAHANVNGWTDGVTRGQLFDNIPKANLTTSPAQADAIVVLSVCHPNFKFNHGLEHVIKGKPWIHVDYLEYGWEFPHLMQSNMPRCGESYPCTQWDNHDWGTFYGFIAAHPPALYFKRELHEQDYYPGKVEPIDFLAANPIPHTASLEGYSRRPFKLFDCHGYSHPMRINMHSGLLRLMSHDGWEVMNSFEALEKRPHDMPWRNKSIISIYQPYWIRRPIQTLLRWQTASMMSLIIPGAGVKCFREQEAPIDTVPVFIVDNLVRSYPLKPGQNCLMLPYDIPHPERALMHYLDMAPEKLYPIYVEAQEWIRKFVPATYIRDFFLPKIKQAI